MIANSSAQTSSAAQKAAFDHSHGVRGPNVPVRHGARQLQSGNLIVSVLPHYHTPYMCHRWAESQDREEALVSAVCLRHFRNRYSLGTCLQLAFKVRFYNWRRPLKRLSILG